MDKACRICGNSVNNTPYAAREMMFGFRDEFEYFQCSKCECLQVTEIPENLDKYYPINYYSFSKPVLPKPNKIKWFCKRQRTRHYLSGKGIIGIIMLTLFGDPDLPNWVKPAGIHLNSKILDVGCGAGHFLVFLQSQGFSNLTGVDPYIDQDYYYDNGVRILKNEIGDLKESFDFIMLHHSFEHLADPINTFKALHEKTACNGLVLIRIPIVPSFAWRKYKTNWVGLDAPRHLFLHSIKSMELLSKRAGFEVESIEFDSTELQFFGSEQYIKDIPLRDPKSYRNGIDNSIFTENDIKKFQMKAEELNVAKEGDSACFLLRKIDTSPNN